MASQSIRRAAWVWCAAVVMLAGSQAAMAVGVGAGPFGPTTPLGPFDISAPGALPIGGWTIGSPQTPLSVEFDSNAGPLVKTLVDAAAFNPDFFINTPIIEGAGPSNGLGGGAASIFALHEHLVIHSGPAWTDWHEEIGADGRILLPGSTDPTPSGGTPFAGFVWLDGPTFGPVLHINGMLAVEDVDYTVMIQSNMMWFFFNNPLPVGTTLDIWKHFEFVGLDDMTSGEKFEGTIEIHEWPTIPAPAALPAGLMLLGAMGLVRRRRAQCA